MRSLANSWHSSLSDLEKKLDKWFVLWVLHDSHVFIKLEGLDRVPEGGLLQTRVHDLGLSSSCDDRKDLAKVTSKDDNLAAKRRVLISQNVAQCSVDGLKDMAVHHGGLIP